MLSGYEFLAIAGCTADQDLIFWLDHRLHYQIDYKVKGFLLLKHFKPQEIGGGGGGNSGIEGLTLYHSI